MKKYLAVVLLFLSLPSFAAWQIVGRESLGTFVSKEAACAAITPEVMQWCSAYGDCVLERSGPEACYWSSRNRMGSRDPGSWFPYGALHEVEGDKCLDRYNAGAVTGWYASAVGAPSLESNKYCDDGCVVAFNAAPTGTSYTNGKVRLQQYSKVPLGYECTAEGTVPSTADPVPPTPEKKPPCADGEGVLTSSSGTVACVPPGTPGSAPPNVTKDKEVVKNPDNSTTEKETTTTTDPQTGAQDKNTTSQNCNGGVCVPGPTTSSNSSTQDSGKAPGDNNGKFCAENPTLQICKDGMATEKTAKAILDALKWEDKTADKSALEKANADYTAAAAEHEGMLKQIGERGQTAPSFFDWALLPDIPTGACQSFTGNIDGHHVTLDWCEKLGMIRELAGYCFYILTAYALFSIFTSTTQGGTK